jgi:hypothetical protein
VCATVSRSAVCVIRIEPTSSGVLITLRLVSDVEGREVETVHRFTEVSLALRQVHDFVVDTCDRYGRVT